MKVINLFVKIANGEEVPKQIKYNDEIWKYDESAHDYYIQKDTFMYEWLMFEIINDFSDFQELLNEEVEIIEDKPSKINHIGSCQNRNEKINEIIDAMNYLLEESDK